MKKYVMRFALLVVACLFIASCSKPPAYTTRTLPSGRVVKIAGIIKMHFSEGDPALMLKYYTDIDMNDKVSLQAEAEDIWQAFKVDVEKAEMKSAILSANQMPRGIISKTSGFNFAFKKQQDGGWLLTNDQKHSANKGIKTDQ